MKPMTLCFLFACSVSTPVVWATVLHVPANYATIQGAIDASVHGDTVLVAPGTYMENIRFKGKRIVVTSHYALNNDPLHILSTVINGSNPVHADTASCVLIVSGEDSSAVLQGFTLTGGRGTKWLDEHGAGLYWEGGGVLTALSSPTIKHNRIIENEAISVTGGAFSAGGGGIRSGDGAPKIVNNIFMSNRGMYGGGLVLNYCAGAVVRNNVFCQNRVYQAVPGATTFGGGGVWINNQLPGNATTNIIENNTIVGNSSLSGVQQGDQGRAGGMLVRENSIVQARSNIVWGNLQSFGGQIAGAGNFSASYNLIEGGFAGIGNIDTNPLFADSAFYLTGGSPCVDAGDPAATYYDPENPSQPGTAAWPSLGSLRNDIGVYGGPWRSVMAAFSRAGIYLTSSSFSFGYVLPSDTGWISIPIKNNGAGRLAIDSVRVMFSMGNVISIVTQLPLLIGPGGRDSLRLRWTPLQNGVLSDTARIYHNDPGEINPLDIHLSGNSNPTPQLFLNTAEHNFGSIDVNVPNKDTTFFVYNIGTGTDSVYVVIDYRNVNPPSALEVSPEAFQIAPADSQGITFTLYPPRINRSGLDIYTPHLLITSRFGLGNTTFDKPFRFRIVGTLPVVEEQDGVSRQFKLEQNYPNPFNPGTSFKFQVPSRKLVTLKVYDVLGREVSTLVDEVKEPGTYTVTWDAGGMSSGVYLCRMRAEAYTATRILVLAK